MNWTPQTSGTGEGLRSIAVLKDHGLLIGGGSGGDLTGSGDGTWTAGPATGLGGVYDLFPYGDGNAWAAGFGGMLGRLTGGGTTWGTV